MAAFFKRLFGSLGKKELRLLILGNDATGKTSILYLLKLGELVTTIPTIGFNVESLEFPGVDFSATCWDIGGWYASQSSFQSVHLIVHSFIHSSFFFFSLFFAFYPL